MTDLTTKRAEEAVRRANRHRWDAGLAGEASPRAVAFAMAEVIADPNFPPPEPVDPDLIEAREIAANALSAAPAPPQDGAEPVLYREPEVTEDETVIDIYAYRADGQGLWGCHVHPDKVHITRTTKGGSTTVEEFNRTAPPLQAQDGRSSDLAHPLGSQGGPAASEPAPPPGPAVGEGT